MPIHRPGRPLAAAAGGCAPRGGRHSRARAVACALGISIVTSAGVASAGPKEWYAEGLTQCEKLAFSSSTFDCKICGVDAGCAGSDCHWGSIRVNGASDAELADGLQRGYQSYCVNQGAAVLPSASTTGMQAAAADDAFRAAEHGSPDRPKGPQPLVLGGVFNATSGKVLGLSIPLSKSYVFKSGDALDLAGSLQVGKGDGMAQFGGALRPGFRFAFGDEAPTATHAFLGLAVPVQLYVDTGSAIETSFVYQLGAGALAGVSKRVGASHFGAGLAADVSYANAVKAPAQALLRWAIDIGPTTLALQPGVSLDPAAGGNVGDTLQINTIAGLEVGSFILGGRFFYQGAEAGGGFAITHVGRLGQTVKDGRIAAPEGARAGEGGEAATPAAAEKASDGDVVMLRDGTSVRGRVDVEEPGVRVVVRAPDGHSETLPWDTVARIVRGAAPAAAPAPAKQAPPAPRAEDSRPALAASWAPRSGLWPEIGVAAQGSIFHHKPQGYVDTRSGIHIGSPFTFGGGGGIAVRAGVALMRAPSAARGSDLLGVRLGAGLDLTGLAADPIGGDGITPYLLVRVPLRVGGMVGGGWFITPRHWRGVVFGVDYEPAISHTTFRETNGATSGQLQEWPQTRFHALGFGATLDVTGLRVPVTGRPALEPGFRMHAGVNPGLGDQPTIATVGFGAVWY